MNGDRSEETGKGDDHVERWVEVRDAIACLEEQALRQAMSQ